MLGFPLGILSAAGAGGDVGTYELIQTQILGTAVSSVVFDVSSVASTYRHLQIRMVARAGRALQNEPLFMRMNGVTGTSYASHGLAGNGSGFFAEGIPSATSMERIGNIAGSTAETNNFGANIIDILDAFSTTKNTTVRTLGGVAPATNPIIGLFSGLFNSTVAVESITLLNFSGTNFVVGSRFSIYGIRG